MIGQRWKCGNTCRLLILIGRGLDFKSANETRRSTKIKCLFNVQLSGCGADNDIISGGNGEGVPPVPIPNTEVKPQHADSTWLETAREGRSSPDSISLNSSMAEHSAVNRRVVGSSPT